MPARNAAEAAVVVRWSTVPSERSNWNGPLPTGADANAGEAASTASFGTTPYTGADSSSGTAATGVSRSISTVAGVTALMPVISVAVPATSSFQPVIGSSRSDP